MATLLVWVLLRKSRVGYELIVSGLSPSAARFGGINVGARLVFAAFCAGGLGTFTYSYTTSTNTAGYNSWAVKTIETLPDNNQNIIYTNAYGEVMLKVYLDTTVSGTLRAVPCCSL